MNDTRDLLERAGSGFAFPDEAFERLIRRRERRSRNRRVGAFAVVAAIGIVATLIAINGVPAKIEHQIGGTEPLPPPEERHLIVDVETGESTSMPASIEGGFFYRVSPDGTMFAYNPCCTPPIEGSIANIDGTDVRVVTPSLVDAYGLAWSPDGGSLVYQGREGRAHEIGNIFVLDVGTGTVRQVTHLEYQVNEWWFLSPDFAPDGDTILFHLPRQSAEDVWDLWSVPASGGEKSLVRRNAGFGVYAPDGDTIAYLSPVRSNFAGGGLWVVDVDGGEPRLLVDGTGLVWPSWSPDGTRIAYGQRGRIFVVDVTTGRSTTITRGVVPEWFDDHTLIVGPG
jgi:WD40 repeat protein